MFVDVKDSFEYIKKNDFAISTISRPRDNSVVYIMKKIEDKLECLYNCTNCFVFYQTGIIIPEDLDKKHVFCESEDAAETFNVFLQNKYSEIKQYNKSRKYNNTGFGYTMGENVSIGDESYIEPGAFIDHDVIIGKNCIIKYGAILRNCVIGDNCVVNEKVLIGNEPYNYYHDNDKHIHAVSVGNVEIGDDVEIGAGSIIDKGTTTTTRIGNNVKIDTLVHIGHDALVGKNVMITSNSIIGGFCEVKDNARIYSAILHKRITVGENTVVGFGSGVLTDVKENVEVFGYPARLIKKFD